MPSDKGDFARRESVNSDVSPGDDFGPLDERFKPGSTRARFEELAATYRSTKDINGRMLSRFDETMDKKASIFQIIQLAKGGELPSTYEIVKNIHKIDFDSMREYATTFQGKKVIDNLEASTNAGAKAFEDINGNDNMQTIITDLDSVRKKTVDDRKVLARKAKHSAEASKDTASIAGKDFKNISRSVATSSTFRKALADMLNIANDMVQNKDPDNVTSEPMTDRIRNMIVEVRENPRMRKSLSSLHALYLTTYNRGSEAAQSAGEQLKDHPANDDLADARSHAKTLFTNLGNGYDITALLSAITEIGNMTRNNKGFSKLTDDARDFGNWALEVDEKELTSDKFKSRCQALIDKSHDVLSDEEREHFKNLSTESTNYMHAVRDNPVLVDYKNSVVELVHSITGSGLTDEERREHIRALRQDLMANLPIMIQAIRYIPLPRIAGQNKEIEFAADNIVLDLKRFVPEHMSLNSHSEVYPRAMMLKSKSAVRSKMGFNGEQFFTLNMTGIHFVAKRVAFYIKKKKGIPRVAEKGIADLLVSGRGMDITMHLRRLHTSEKPKVPAEKSNTSSVKGKEAEGTTMMHSQREFDIISVSVKMHNLDIKMRENKHTISSKLALSLMNPVARKLISKNIAKSLTDNLILGDMFMARYGATAQGFLIDNSKKAINSAKGTVKKSTKKSKEQINKARKKSSNVVDKANQRRDSLVDEEPAAVAQEAA
ncbi:hypothetical protein GGH14_002905 [Coemansia sp. RSA 370]|nr:hypothetical protein GGH14_002905 [Coemansia sp. RSA 370]KAJ2407094.1 hypothetical protein J3F80_003068 [Coemansia sp. RSA 2526]KAJ2555082.1 hypothetical protein IWW35_000918 [Coemansia sp. RSA 1878]